MSAYLETTGTADTNFARSNHRAIETLCENTDNMFLPIFSFTSCRSSLQRRPVRLQSRLDPDPRLIYLNFKPSANPNRCLDKRLIRTSRDLSHFRYFRRKLEHHGGNLREWDSVCRGHSTLHGVRWHSFPFVNLRCKSVWAVDVLLVDLS